MVCRAISVEARLAPPTRGDRNSMYSRNSGSFTSARWEPRGTLIRRNAATLRTMSVHVANGTPFGFGASEMGRNMG